MRSMQAWVIVAAGLVGVAGGCSSSTSSKSFFKPDTWAYKSKKDDPVYLAVAGPVAVDVESFNGNVTIYANHEATFATVAVVREAMHGFGRSVESEVSLDEIDYTAEIVPGQLGQLLKMRTRTTHAEPYYQRAHITIELPEINGVTVRTQNGDVEVLNIEGEIDIKSSGGNVRVMTLRPMVRPVTILNQKGDIDYRVRGNSTGEFHCESIGGSVDQRVRYGRLLVHHGTDDNTLLATFNYGKNDIRLHTTEGDIRVAVVTDPTAVGKTIFAP